MNRLQQFIAELRRRRVFRVLVAYGIFCFATLQVIEPVLHAYDLPQWLLTGVVTALVLGFPVAMVLAWVFDITAEGVKRTPAATGAEAVTLSRGRLAALLLGVGVVAALPGVGWYAWRKAADRASGADPAASTPSIAVLPFADMSEKHDQEYFSDGIAEEILNALAHLDGLRVAGRTSSFAFKGRNEDLKAIGRRLNVGAVLEGSVRKEGNRVRVTAQVVKVADGFHLWSETYDRELSGIFAVQDDIARSVVEALKVRLLSGKGPAPGRRPTVDPEAYTQFLIGRQLWNQVSMESVRRSAEAFQRAVEIDPSYAPAWAALAMSAQDVGHDKTPAGVEAGARRALAAAEKAIALDPGLAEGYNARGVLRARHDWDWKGALSDVERARSLQPGDAVSQRRYGVLRLMLGQPGEAIAALRKATELDPLSAITWAWLARAYMASGDLGQARAAVDRAAEIAPDSEEAKGLAGMLALLDRRPADARAILDSLPVKEEMRLGGVAVVEHDLGHPDRAQKALDEFVTRHPEQAYSIASTYAWFGDRDRAFEWLDRALTRRDYGLADVRWDPMLRGLHDDPRWKPFLRKMNMPVE